MSIEIQKTCDDGILGLTVGARRITFWPESSSHKWGVFNGKQWIERNQTEFSDGDSTFVVMALNLIQAEVLSIEEMDALHAWIDTERATYT